MSVKPLQFIDEVKKEAKKVVWPDVKTVRSSTLVVLVMVLIASVFFSLTDYMLYQLIQVFLLG